MKPIKLLSHTINMAMATNCVVRRLPISAMAAVTKSLSFCITASTTYESPFMLARRFATLDHLTNGRVGWNIVTSYLESAARNFGLEEQLTHEERYAKADEFLEVTYKLWEGSWRNNTAIRNEETKQYVSPDHVRRINHEGYRCWPTSEVSDKD